MEAEPWMRKKIVTVQQVLYSGSAGMNRRRMAKDVKEENGYAGD